MPLKMFDQSKKNGGLSSIRHVIGVAAGKGGVGKSTVAVNLARALLSLGYSVGVMDTDIYGPSIRKMLPEDRLPGRKGDKIVPAFCEGLSVLTLAYFRKENEAAAIRAPIANGIVNQFIHGVEWGSLDFLIIDFPPGTGDIQLTLAQQARLTGAVMVTTPQEVAVMDVRKAMSLFDQVRVPVLGVVENMSYYQGDGKEKIYLFGKGGGARLAAESGVPLLGQIPVDPLLSESGDSGHSPLSNRDRAAPIAETFVQIARSVAEHAEALKNHHNNVEGRFELVWKEMQS